MKTKNNKNLIIQANDADKILEIFYFLKHSPKSKWEISEEFNFNKRQASYYSSALMSLELAQNFNYHNKKIIALSKKGMDLAEGMDKKQFAKFIYATNFIEKQRGMLEKSNFATATKKRRESSLNSIEKWMEKNIDEF